MVVEARDLAMVDQGFESDASDAIPLDDDLLIPDGDDGVAPIEVDDESEAATEDGVLPFDFDTLPDADKSALEALFRSHLEGEFEERRREFQATKDREINLSRAREMARAKVYATYLKEMGVDQRDIKALEYEVQQETQQWARARQKQEQEQAQTQQTQASDEAHISSEIGVTTSLMQEHAKSVGLDLTNEKIAAQIDKHWKPVATAARVFLMFPTTETRAAYDEAKEVHKEWVTALGTAQKRRSSATKTSDALGRQRNRGVQNTATGGAGAGPIDGQAIAAKAWELHPTDERARIQYVTEQMNAAQPRR